MFPQKSLLSSSSSLLVSSCIIIITRRSVFSFMYQHDYSNKIIIITAFDIIFSSSRTHNCPLDLGTNRGFLLFVYCIQCIVHCIHVHKMYTFCWILIIIIREPIIKIVGRCFKSGESPFHQFSSQKILLFVNGGFFDIIMVLVIIMTIMIFMIACNSQVCGASIFSFKLFPLFSWFSNCKTVIINVIIANDSLCF